MIENVQLLCRVEVTKTKKFSPSVFYFTICKEKEYLNDTLNRKTILLFVFQALFILSFLKKTFHI